MLYTELTPAQVKALAASVDALSESLSKLTSTAISQPCSLHGNAHEDPVDHSAENAGSHDEDVPSTPARCRRSWCCCGRGAAVGIPAAARAATAAPSPDLAYPFYGEHQAGIVTPAQDRLHFSSFDLQTTSRAELVALLKAWTAAANRMTQGAAAGQFGPTGGSYDGPPDDTGEAQGLPPSGLTITFGFGPSLFEGKRAAALGTAGKRPPALADIPAFPGDTLDAAQSGGDLCIQACANDPQVAVHAVRNLARIAFGTAHVRWSQLGFGRTSSTSTSQQTPRNLFGSRRNRESQG